jgi:type VI secretion system Hcp family effector
VAIVAAGVASAALLAVSLSGPAGAAERPCVTVTGDASGKIQGEPKLSRCSAASFEAQEYHHLVRSNSEKPGSEIHEPVVFIKEVDKSSPKLWAVHRDREPLTVEFSFYRAGGGGSLERYYVVELRDARIVAMEPITEDVDVAATAGVPDRERIRIGYQTLVIRYLPDGEEGEDLVNESPPQ